jgi:hypothetical protein
MIEIKVDKKGLCEILGLKESGLKTIIKRKQLDKRLDEQGYKLLEQIKEGRKVYYILEQTNNNKEVYNNMCKYIFNTNKPTSFKDFFISRTVFDNFVKSNKDLAELSNVSAKTISKWNNTLLDKNIIAKDGYFYFYIDKEHKTIKQCEKVEYNTFWRNKAISNSFKTLQSRYLKGEITLNELQIASAGLGATVALIENKYYYRIKKYKTNKDNQLYLDMLELIKAIYGNKEIKIEYELIE